MLTLDKSAQSAFIKLIESRAGVEMKDFNFFISISIAGCKEKMDP